MSQRQNVPTSIGTTQPWNLTRSEPVKTNLRFTGLVASWYAGRNCHTEREQSRDSRSIFGFMNGDYRWLFSAKVNLHNRSATQPIGRHQCSLSSTAGDGRWDASRW